MEVKLHPIYGIAVREDGAICSIDGHTKKHHWFYGYKNVKGYCKAKIAGKYRHVGRVVLETFVRLPKDGEQCDHIDRNRSNNNVANLRWATPTENARNTRGNDRAKAKYGCNWFEDRNAYQRAWRKANRDSANRSARKYRLKHKEAPVCTQA